MALIKCPECNLQVSDKAFSCPHCGFPMKPTEAPKKRKRASAIKRRRNGTGTVVTLSGNRTKPYEVRVNCHLDSRGYPVYDVLGRFSDRVDAEASLADYNRTPYNVKASKATFKEVYELYYDEKYNKGRKKYSKSSMSCTKGAFNKCKAIHDRIFRDITPDELQDVLDGRFLKKELSHAYMEHINLLIFQMYKFAMKYDIVQKNQAEFISISKSDDDEPGVPFTENERKLLWAHKNEPNVDMILIYMYSGWRRNELRLMPSANIDLENKTFQGGNKTSSGKNRIVPINSKIYDFVKRRLENNSAYLFMDETDPSRIISDSKLNETFQETLTRIGITAKHTPHDCRHTFNSMLDDAGVNKYIRKMLMGHSLGKDTIDKRYTHKELKQLREAVEQI